MAQDFLPSEESRQIVPPAWTKLVTKAGDIVRQQTNVKVTSTPAVKERIDSRMEYGRFIAGIEKDALSRELEFAEEPLEVAPHLLLAQQLESVLREAKETSLHCEVLVPCDLTTRIARDIIRMSEFEPCGLRGCLVYINMVDKTVTRRVGKLKCDMDTVPTFELNLTLQRDSGNWLSLKQLIPGRLLKRIVGRSPALIVSEAFTLSKKKLYRSCSLD